MIYVSLIWNVTKHTTSPVPALTLAHYGRALGDGFYLEVFGRTLGMAFALVVVLVAIIIFSYRAWRENRAKDPLSGMNPGLYQPRNNADTLVFQTERLLAEQGEKVEAGEREKIESALKALKDALAGADIEAVKQAHEALVGASQEFAQRLYAAASAQQGAPGGAEAPSDDEVAEAEIVDEDNA